jgi:ATP-binding cassette subfamily C protein CydC
LADFKVLIFDEPTANVDDETADELAADLIAIVAKDSTKASLFISHDPRFRNLVDFTQSI